MSSYEYPISQTSPCPNIGQGFDLMLGAWLIPSPFDTPPQNLLQKVMLTAGDSATSLVKDLQTFTATSKRHLDVVGRGWGASVGMSLSESSLSASTASSVTLNFDAFQASYQVVIDPNMQLLPAAADKLEKNPAEFFATYGRYFVAGYIYGKRCSMAYRASFATLKEQGEFSANLQAAYDGGAFGATMAAAIKTAHEATKTHSTVSTLSRTAGFTANTPTELNDLVKLKAAYDDAPPSEATVIKIVVLPWYYLRCVSDKVDLVSNYYLDRLAELVSGLGYIVRSCDDFVDGARYAGAVQLNAVRELGEDAQHELNAVNAFLAKIHDSSTPASAADFKNFAPIDTLRDRMDFALDHFVVTFKVHIADDDTDCNSLLPPVGAGTFPPVANRVFDGARGTYMTWSSNKYPGFDTFARTIRDKGVLSADVIAVLDSEAGTMQVQVNRPGEAAVDSDKVTIRGSSNTRACDDPNNRSAIREWYAGKGLKISASVM